MPLEDSARIGIHDKNRMIAGIQQDGVGRFRPYPMNGQKLFPHNSGWSLKHFAERPVMLRSQKSDKLFQFAGLLTEVAGRTDQTSELAQRNAFHGFHSQELFLSQGGDGPLDVRPGRILRQDRADNDFKSCSARPPVLRSVSRKKRMVISMENGLCREWGRLRLSAKGPKGVRPRLIGNWQNRRNRHLFRKIATQRWQVKVASLPQEAFACPGVQVLANSQRWVKIERRRIRAFAMFGGRCTAVRECSGCPSV
jgi:hypothetical protein